VNLNEWREDGRMKYKPQVVRARESRDCDERRAEQIKGS
jgi:hypothetical protein